MQNTRRRQGSGVRGGAVALSLSLVATAAGVANVGAQVSPEASPPGVTLAARGANAGVQPRDPAEVERELGESTQLVERLEGESRAVETEEQALPARREAATQRARREIRMLYHLTQGAGLAMQGGPEATLEHAARLDRVRHALRTTLRELDESSRRIAGVRADRARLGVLLADARARRETLERERTETQALAALRLPVSTAGLAGDPIGGGMAGNVVQPPAQGVTVYGGTVAATASEAPTFGDAVGRLPLPLAGRVEVRRAQRDGADGPGVEIVAPLGSPVRAVYPGRVAFADRYGVYGRIVILDHGEHYYTVSANLASVNVRVGEEVPTGGVLGTVGDDGRGPSLYFEVRRGSETIDPAPWFGL